MEGGDGVLHPGVMEEALSANRRRLRGLQPFRGALKVVSQVGQEGRPQRGRGRPLGVVVGVYQRGVDDGGAQRSGEAAASVGGGGGGWAAT